MGQVQACFSPPLPNGCDPLTAIVNAIQAASHSIRVQIYALTSQPIVAALAAAKQRRVDVRVILDRSQLVGDSSESPAVGRLISAGIPIMVDTVPGLMHDKNMVIDGQTVLTGSFNYTWSAEHRNAETLLVIHNPQLAAQYTNDWNMRASRSRPLTAVGALPQLDASKTPGAVRGNRRTMIYQWPGCPYYDKIAPSNRVSFPTAQAAQAAGYRAARNCPPD